MSKTRRGIGLLAAMALLLIPLAASAADQEVQIDVLPEGTLSIDVEGEIYFGPFVPGADTGLAEFYMGITNLAGSGWQVDVSGTDLIGFNWDCPQGDECTRVATGYTIPANAISVRGGDQDNWGIPGAIEPVAGEVNLVAADTPYLLMTGTADASGSFGLDEQRPGVRIQVPITVGDVSGDEYSSYYTILTYSIIGS